MRFHCRGFGLGYSRLYCCHDCFVGAVKAEVLMKVILITVILAIALLRMTPYSAFDYLPETSAEQQLVAPMNTHLPDFVS